MARIASLFSSSGVSFRSGAVPTKIAEGSERRFRLLRHNNVKRKSGNKRLSLVLLPQEFTTPARQNFSQSREYPTTGHATLRLALLVGASLMAHPMADKTLMMVPIRGFLPFERAL